MVVSRDASGEFPGMLPRNRAGMPALKPQQGAETGPGKNFHRRLRPGLLRRFIRENFVRKKKRGAAQFSSVQFSSESGVHPAVIHSRVRAGGRRDGAAALFAGKFVNGKNKVEDEITALHAKTWPLPWSVIFWQKP